MDVFTRLVEKVVHDLSPEDHGMVYVLMTHKEYVKDEHGGMCWATWKRAFLATDAMLHRLQNDEEWYTREGATYWWQPHIELVTWSWVAQDLPLLQPYDQIRIGGYHATTVHWSS